MHKKQGVPIWKKEVVVFVFVSKVPKTTLLDLHMMVAEPEQWVQPCAEAGGNMYTFHIGELFILTTFTLVWESRLHIFSSCSEAAKEPGALCKQIKEAGMKVGVGLKPGTKVDVVTEWVDQGLVDMVLVMTVEPGFGGQSFMAGMMPKVEALRQAYPTLDIEVSCLKIAQT